MKIRDILEAKIIKFPSKPLNKQSLEQEFKQRQQDQEYQEYQEYYEQYVHDELDEIKYDSLT